MNRGTSQTLLTVIGLGLAAVMLGGCSAPISATRVTPAQAYAQVEANALRTGRPSASTRAILHRYDLDRLAEKQPDEVVRRLHEKAVATGERDLLFALAETSYVAAEHLRHVVKPWDTRDPRDYYLGSAVYAWLFLFGDGKDPKPGMFDRRLRQACDFYNCSLGLAFTEKRGTNGVVQLVAGQRRLPVGLLQLQIQSVNLPEQLVTFEQVLLADQLRVKGLSVRNRDPGLGAPLICVKQPNPEFGLRPSIPATMVLRGPACLEDLISLRQPFSLELYSGYGTGTISVGSTTVPLETDLTAFRAYTLTQSRVWALGKLGFLAPAERIPSQLMLTQPYEPDRIPVVYVHGTFSSPVTWAEMANSLTADPVLRQHYQVWTFVYGSGNPLVQSVADLRQALTAKVQQLDPQGTNALLRQMVVIGHSQGGLLTKSTAVNAGDRLWRVFSTNRFEDLQLAEADREKLKRYLFLEPLPFVRRVVFIATPHRGSYLAGGFARDLARRLVSLPGNMVARSGELVKVMGGSEIGGFLRGRMPTSLDGMSPKNPALLAMADILVAPGIKAHSIIAVQDNGDPSKGKDGLVAYRSAHLENVESEFIVRSFHSCLDNPATIEEVRRILRLHLAQTAGASHQ
jgi:pimeloyl-ACP methyl ester carboxylesterase